MIGKSKIEQFSATELAGLRNGIKQSGIDYWQAAELVSGFLTGRGYGVSPQNARAAVARLEAAGCDLECMQQELERLAIVM